MSLQQLKEIRQKRMEKQSIEVGRCKAVIAQKEHELEVKKEELESYAKWRTESQEKMFDNLQTALFSPQDLHKYMDTQESMKEEEGQKREALKQYEEEIELARQKYREARIVLAEITKKLEKINEMIKEEKRLSDEDEKRKEESANEEIATLSSLK